MGGLLRAVGALVVPGAVGAVSAGLRLHAVTVQALASAVRGGRGGTPARVAASPGDAAALWRLWAAYVVGATAALVAGLVALPTVPVALLGAAGVAAALTAGAVRAAYGGWLLRGGQGGWAAFRRQPGEWLPPSPPPGGAAAGWGRRAALPVAVIVTLAPMAAGAAAPEATAAAVGKAAEMLAVVLPGVGAGTPWTHALGAWSSILVGLGGGMLAWHTLIGAVATAHEGRVLGSRWHTTWAPLRVCLGMALLVPIPGAGGLSGAHLALGQAAVLASDAASGIWSDYVSESLGVDAQGRPLDGASAGIPAVAAAVEQAVGGTELARRVAVAELCAQIRDTELRRLGRDPVGLPPTRGTTAGERQVWDYGEGCGSLSLPAAVAADAPTLAYQRARTEAVGALVGAVRSAPAVGSMVDGSLPSTGVTWPAGPVGPVLSAPAAAYSVAMTRAVGEYVTTRDREARGAVVAQAQRDGWVSAGALWGALGAASAGATALAADRPGYVEPSPADLSSWWRSDPSEFVTDALKRLHDTLAAEDRAAGGVDPEALSQMAGGGDLLARLTAPVTRPLTQAAFGLAAANPADPLSSIVSTGHVIVGASEVAILGGAAVAAAARNLFGDAVGAGGAWDWVSGWARVVIGASYTGGWLQGYLLPLTPAISMIWVQIGWLIALVEAAIALPVLAFLFIRLDGQEFVDSVQRPGIIVAVNVCLRPIFSVLALIIGTRLLPLGLGLVAYTLPTAWFSAQAGHTVSIGGIVGAYVLTAYLEYQVAARLLGAAHEIPDRVLRWWGSPGEGLNEGSHAGAAASAAGAAAAAMGRGRAPSSSGGRPGRGGGGDGGGDGGGTVSPVDGDGGGVSKLANADDGAETLSPAPAVTTSGVSKTGLGGGGASSSWMRARGGLDGLSADQRRVAESFYRRWARENPRPAKHHGLGSYVKYVQAQQAERDGRG